MEDTYTHVRDVLKARRENWLYWNTSRLGRKAYEVIELGKHYRTHSRDIVMPAAEVVEMIFKRAGEHVDRSSLLDEEKLVKILQQKLYLQPVEPTKKITAERALIDWLERYTEPQEGSILYFDDIHERIAAAGKMVTGYSVTQKNRTLVLLKKIAWQHGLEAGTENRNTFLIDRGIRVTPLPKVEPHVAIDRVTDIDIHNWVEANISEKIGAEITLQKIRDEIELEKVAGVSTKTLARVLRERFGEQALLRKKNKGRATYFLIGGTLNEGKETAARAAQN